MGFPLGGGGGEGVFMGIRGGGVPPGTPNSHIMGYIREYTTG